MIKTDSLYPGGSVGVNIMGSSMVVGVWEPSAAPVDGNGVVTHDLLIGKATNQVGQLVSNVPANGNHASHVTGTMVGWDIASRPRHAVLPTTPTRATGTPLTTWPK